MKNLLHTSMRVITALVLLLVPLIVLAQNAANPPSSLAGKYQGVAKTATGDVQITLQLNDEAGKFSGHLVTPQGQFEVVKGRMADGLLSLDLDAKGSAAKLRVRQREDKLVGEWSRAGQAEPVELKKIDELSGDWEAIANINDQNYPFSLSLKVEGEKVTGGSSSEIGNATITRGLLKDGKLVIELIGTGGAVILMDATLKDGNLIGSLDFNGQVQGSWVAVKRK